MINRDVLHFDMLKMFIIDEADDMLDRGFLDQIKLLLRHIDENVQICLFSATLPLDILDSTKKFMNNPMNILVKKDELTLDGIHQYYISLDHEEYKFNTLCDLYESMSITQAIIYCNTRQKVEWLSQQLTNLDHEVSCIHGEMHFDMEANDGDGKLDFHRWI